MLLLRRSVFVLGITATTTVAAQPPDQTKPPPQAPDPSWAPPPPGEAPPPPATGETPPPPGDAERPSDAPRQPEKPPPKPEPRTKMEIYGHVMLDLGFDFGHIGDPNWQDVMRPSKLPAFEDEFGKGPRTYAGVRQSRFGVKTWTPTDAGEIKTMFEFELFGVGIDEGQTTFRLRHAYGDWRSLRAGQTWSPFMDIDVFPNSLEYWGPPGMAFFRNVQLAWMPIQGDSRVTVAVERPGASADVGNYAERVELAGVIARFPAPDLSAEARYGGAWGYVELAGILRWITWDALMNDDADGEEIGWGVNLSSNIKLAPAVIRLQALYGHGVQNYMNDSTADIGVVDPETPGGLLEGDALPVLGLVGFVDLEWNEHFTSSAGYSLIWIDNSNGQAPDAFHLGHYALANLLWHPTKKLMIGAELQFGRRENNDDDFGVNDFKVQLGVKYSFSKTFGGD